MATSIKLIAGVCLSKTGRLSLRRDIFGVYRNDNPKNRSLLSRVNLIKNRPFFKIAVVVIQDASGRPANSAANLQQDLDDTNDIYLRDCNAWVYPVDVRAFNRPRLLMLYQEDCKMGGFLGIGGHTVSDEEDQLFDLGRDLGANIVAYYINGSSNLPDDPDAPPLGGCAAHPDNRKGFWVKGGRYFFAHELTHILWSYGHNEDTTRNLMWKNNIGWFTGSPFLNDDQCEDIRNDEEINSCVL